MTALVSLDQVKSLLDNHLTGPASEQTSRLILDALTPVRPAVVCHIEGGLLSEVYASHDLDVTALDFDTDTVSESDQGVDLGNGQARRIEQHVHIDPDYPTEVAAADLIDLLNTSDESDD